MDIFSKNLIYLRKKLNLTQEKLSENIGFKRSKYAGYEAGKSKPEYNSLIRLCEYYDVSVDNLIYTDFSEPKKDIMKIIREASGFSLPPKEKTYPLMPMKGFAGKGSELLDGINLDAIEERYTLTLFDALKPDFIITVTGNSMQPTYLSGDKVICKLIESADYVQWNKPYIIDSISQGVLLKRLKPSSNIDMFTIKSDNADYDDFEIPRKDIRKIAIVVGLCRIE